MRDRVTVDLRGIRPQLQAQAAKRQMSAAALVRHAVTAMLDDAPSDVGDNADTDSLDALNRRLWAWVEAEYHHNPHRGLDGQTPLDLTWDRMARLAAEWLQPPRVLHPWPQQRFAVKHPR